MKNNDKIVGATGTTLLQLVFIVLKLCGVINWSWLWVLSPLWITILIFVIVVIVVWIHVRG